jgi:hypothetical protein
VAPATRRWAINKRSNAGALRARKVRASAHAPRVVRCSHAPGSRMRRGPRRARLARLRGRHDGHRGRSGRRYDHDDGADGPRAAAVDPALGQRHVRGLRRRRDERGRRRLEPAVVGRRHVGRLVVELVVVVGGRVIELFQLVERRKQLRRRVQRSCGARGHCVVQRVWHQSRLPGQRLLQRLLVQALDDEVRGDAFGLLTESATMRSGAARGGAGCDAVGAEMAEALAAERSRRCRDRVGDGDGDG